MKLDQKINYQLRGLKIFLSLEVVLSHQKRTIELRKSKYANSTKRGEHLAPETKESDNMF